jgi:hypothetical protein
MSEGKPTWNAAGIAPNMPFDQYQALEGINATAIKAGAESMLQMHAVMTGSSKADTPAMRWGRLVHLAILEPDRFAEVASIFDGRKTGYKWREHCEGFCAEWVVSVAEYAELMQIRDAVYRNKEAAFRILHSQHEASTTWENARYGTGKARLDMLNAGAWFGDIKTACDISPGAMSRQYLNLGYDLQMGWYSEAAKTDAAYIIAVRSGPAYDCIVYTIPPAMIQDGREKAIEIAMRYRACSAAKSWPGISETGVEVLELPPWALGGENAEVSMEGVAEL